MSKLCDPFSQSESDLIGTYLYGQRPRRRLQWSAGRRWGVGPSGWFASSAGFIDHLYSTFRHEVAPAQPPKIPLLLRKRITWPGRWAVRGRMSEDIRTSVSGETCPGEAGRCLFTAKETRPECRCSPSRSRENVEFQGQSVPRLRGGLVNGNDDENAVGEIYGREDRTN
jgi:hypothetical protein